MNKFNILLLTLISFTRMASDSCAYYMEVGSLSMDRAGSTRQYIEGNDRYLSQTFQVTNIGDDNLSHVGLAWTFVYSGNWAFDYDSQTHSWQREITMNDESQGVHSLEVFTQSPFDDSGEQTYLSLNRDITNLSLSYSANNRITDHPLFLNEADEVPVFWLGDLAPGQSVFLAWYALQTPYISDVTDSAWSFHIQNSFVAECIPIPAVPLVGSIWFLGGGLLILMKKQGKRFH
ncbi:MAG: hypothetical protein KKD44_25625 [Proteobacteria bacterium]|nr:hypothetical protein [Pseudomonadota bacterium]